MSAGTFILPGYMPTGAVLVTNLFADLRRWVDGVDEEEAEYETAVEKKWWVDRGMEVPMGGWEIVRGRKGEGRLFGGRRVGFGTFRR